MCDIGQILISIFSNDTWNGDYWNSVLLKYLKILHLKLAQNIINSIKEILKENWDEFKHIVILNEMVRTHICIRNEIHWNDLLVP